MTFPALRLAHRCTMVVLLLTVAPPMMAQAGRAPGTSGVPIPIVLVHGNGDHAGMWDQTIMRFASNGYPEERLFAVDLPSPVASSTIRAVEANRSTPEDQTAALSAFVTRVLLRTGASKVALIGSSRGGLTIMNYLRFGGGASHVSHVITCGTPHHGVFANATTQLDGESNGAGAYVQSLNSPREVVPGVRFLTLRSDRLDKYAQPDGAGLGMAGASTTAGFDGPALRGAINVVLPGTDHREVAFGPAAFDAQYRFLTGRLPTRTTIAPQSTVVLNGMISANASGAPTNLPLAGAIVTVHEVDSVTGIRVHAAAHRAVTNHTGRWGPFVGQPGRYYEFEVVQADSAVILHLFRSPFLRSTDLVHIRLPAPPRPRLDSVSVLMVRPRGYLGVGRDTVMIDAQPARGIPVGVPSADRVLQWFARDTSRSVRTRINGETIVVRTYPSDVRRLVLAEFSGDGVSAK